MSSPADVCVLVPTLNEDETIADVVSDFRNHGYTNVLVVDGGSTDDTRDIAESEGARVVVQSATGKGQAVREAIRKHVDAPYVLMLDGDGTYNADDAEAMLEPLSNGYDHVIGDRFADMRPGAMTKLNRIGNRIINRSFATIHGKDFGDILSGYRAFTTDSFDRMTLTADGFGIETEMAVECVKHDIPTAVVPITYRPRPSGSDTNLRPFRDGGIIFLEIYRRAKTNNPLFYFGSVGTLALLAGVVFGGYVGYDWFVNGISHEVIAVVAAFSVIVGVQLLIFGVISDMLLTLHRERMRRLDDIESVVGSLSGADGRSDEEARAIADGDDSDR
jgi:dolichol-phosphate mannosyltransferase